MSHAESLENRVALVTGASRGIGKGIAEELAAAGAKVYFTARSVVEDPDHPGTVSATAEAIRDAGGDAIGIQCDHHADDQVAAVFERIQKDEGRLDVLVNNATAELSSMVGKRFWELPFSLWDDVIGVGLRSHYVATAHAARMMIPREGGLIVNVSSHGSKEYLMGVIYGVGKAGVEKLTSDTALELREHDVAVISIWPGLVKSENRLAKAERTEDGRLTLFGLDLAEVGESPAFSGRAVAALAADSARIDKTGRAFWLADLAREYGFTDADGSIPDARALHESLQSSAPDYWKGVLGTGISG